MKNTILFSFIILLFSSNLEAAHVTGGEITYRYIGDSTNVNYHYEVTLVLYATNRWTNFQLPTTSPMCITSSCYPDITRTIPAADGYTPPGQPIDDGGCTFTNSPNYMLTTKMVYIDTIALPGACHDFRFRSSAQCCRVGAVNVANIQTWEANTIHFIAYLNNAFGENNSPQFTTDPQTTYCVNSTVNMIQNVFEADGDSLLFNFADARSTNSTVSSCIDNTQLSNSSYQTGFHVEKPFDTQGNVSITIDQTNGNASFNSGSMAGTFLLSIAVLEYRINPADSNYNIVGRVVREILVVFDDCPPSQSNSFLSASQSQGPGQSGAYNYTPISTDHRVFFLGYEPKDSVSFSQSPTGYVFQMPDVPFACSDTLIELTLGRPILNSSVNPDNIFVVGPDTQAITTQSVSFNQGAFSDVITLELTQPLHLNGQHFVIIARDTLNPMINICSFEFTDTILFSLTATNCPDFMSNTKHQRHALDIKLSPNPADAYVNIHNPSSSMVHFTLYDLRGVAHHSGAVAPGLTLDMDISDLPSGMYIVSFVDANGRLKREKVVKR